jgi:tRNA pseudouridine13 synthase
VIESWPLARGDAAGSALLRCLPEDFVVCEELGFDPDGEGEHRLLRLRKSELNTAELAGRIAALCDVPLRDVGYCGLKDRNAVTTQWFSVGLAGRAEPNWCALEDGGAVTVLETARHRRKLRRGVHRANRFALTLREVRGERAALEGRLESIRREGVPNYFGAQRFGRGGSTLAQARGWAARGGRLTRARRSLYLSALRGYLFNRLLAERVRSGDWNRVAAGDVCMLAGTRSRFCCEEVDDALLARVAAGDVHPGLPLWGRVKGEAQPPVLPADCMELGAALEGAGVDLDWRAARLLPDDFCWQFCDDGTLQLDFALGAGGYATALVVEFVHYKEGRGQRGIGSERG